MKKLNAAVLWTTMALFGGVVHSQEKQPLKLIKSVPLPALHNGDFDHFAVDLQGKRLFAAAEENSKALVFDLDTGKLLQTLSDLKAPHSVIYRDDLKKLYVVDGDLGKIRMYDGITYKNVGDIDVREGADSMAYEQATKYMYIVTGGNDAKMPNCYLTVVDTTAAKKIGDIKLDSDDVETILVEKSGPRLFVLVRGNNAVEVFNRQNQTLLATWPLPKDATKPSAMAIDEATHRLFIGARNPGKLIVLDSDSGRVITSQPAASMIDDMGFDDTHKEIFFAGTEFLDVFQERDSNHVERVGHIPTAFRAKTGLFVPELNRFYLGVPYHNGKSAELRIYEVQP
jgi:DNA-binding beta-propeller fold protein YncE